MDDLDRASELEQKQRDAALARARQGVSLPYTGHCHYCGDITGGGRRFCDADCRDGYEAARRARRRNGHGG